MMLHADVSSYLMCSSSRLRMFYSSGDLSQRTCILVVVLHSYVVLFFQGTYLLHCCCRQQYKTAVRHVSKVTEPNITSLYVRLRHTNRYSYFITV